MTVTITRESFVISLSPDSAFRLVLFHGHMRGIPLQIMSGKLFKTNQSDQLLPLRDHWVYLILHKRNLNDVLSHWCWQTVWFTGFHVIANKMWWLFFFNHLSHIHCSGIHVGYFLIAASPTLKDSIQQRHRHIEMETKYRKLYKLYKSGNCINCINL